jgi:hypothetical protein
MIEMSKYSPITLVGFGIAGQLLLSHILDEVDGNKVTIIDPDFIGGDFVRQQYGSIQSNTTVSQMIGNLSDKWSKTINSLNSRAAPSDTVRLSDFGIDMRKTSAPLAAKCQCVYDKVTSASWNPEAKRWTLNLESGSSRETSIVCFCSGMISRQEDYGIPTIPLSNALDKASLMRIISPGERVVVIGSSHSATLILKNLNGIDDISVTCIYRGEKPFRFARDSEYDGIKQESAAVADAILSGEYTNLKLVRTNDIKNICANIRSADWIIQATGFHSCIPTLICGNEEVNPVWDPKTGTTTDLPQAQAFGACVPDTTRVGEKDYPDISISSFIDQLLTRWPLLKANIQNLL